MSETPPTFVLVHGAWHGAWCWDPVLPLLQQAGHCVLAPDLPGHGRDLTPLHRLSLKTYTRALVQRLQEIEENVVLVGHSMGGMVISQVAELLPHKISRLIYLAAFLPQHGQSVFDLMAANRLARTEFESARAGEAETAIETHLQMSVDKRSCRIAPEAIASLFYNRCTPRDVRWARSRFAEQATLPLSGRVSLRSGGFAALPKTYISCLHDRVIPIQHQRRMIARQPCHKILQLDSDHSPFLSAPGELAAILASL